MLFNETLSARSAKHFNNLMFIFYVLKFFLKYYISNCRFERKKANFNIRENLNKSTPPPPHHDNDCGQLFIIFCKLRKKYLHISLSLCATFLKEFPAIFPF